MTDVAALRMAPAQLQRFARDTRDAANVEINVQEQWKQVRCLVWVCCWRGGWSHRHPLHPHFPLPCFSVGATASPAGLVLCPAGGSLARCLTSPPPGCHAPGGARGCDSV